MTDIRYSIAFNNKNEKAIMDNCIQDEYGWKKTYTIQQIVDFLNEKGVELK